MDVFLGPYSPTVSNGMIYTNGGIFGERILAFGINGEKKWEFNNHSSVMSAPISYEGIIYTGSNNGKLYAIDGNSGLKKWESPLCEYDNFFTAPTVVNGLVYVGSTDNNFYAVDAMSGEMKWKFKAGGMVFSPACVVTENSKAYHSAVSGMTN